MLSRRIGRLLGPGLAAMVAAVLLLPGLFVGPSLDASIFSTVGWRLAEGDALYAEVWDHKPPGAYLPYAVAHLLTDAPATAWSVAWAFTVMSIAGAALAIDQLLVRMAVQSMARLATGALIALGAASYIVSLGGGMTETFALLPLAAALLAATAARWVLAGVLVGLAVVVSLQSAPIVAAIAVVGIARERRQPLQRAGAFLAGLFAVGAVVTLGLWANGGLASAGDALVGYSAAYRAVTARGGGASAFALVPWTVLVLLPLIVGAGIALVHRRRLASGRLGLACAAWIVATLALIAFQGRFYAHYAAPMVIPLAVLSGLGLEAMWRTTPTRLRLPAIAAPLAVVLGLALAVGAAGARDEEAPVRASNIRAAAAARHIRATTVATDAIFVWGNDARIYELADRAPAVRYVYLYPLLTPGYATSERIDQVAVELERALPAVIVDSGSLGTGTPGLPPLLEPRPVATDGRDADLLNPLRELVRSSYQLDATSEAWPIYARSPSP